MSRCGIVVLAAGGSARLGRPKQSLTLAGETLLARAARSAVASACRPVVVVLALGPRRCATLSPFPVRVVVNEHWRSGMGSSICAGVRDAVAAGGSLDAVAVCLCDQPLVTGESIDALVEAWRASRKPVCAAAYGGTVGTPAVFSAALFDELLALGDGEGGKVILRRHASDVAPFDMPGAETDVDTEAEYQRVAARFEKTPTVEPAG